MTPQPQRRVRADAPRLAAYDVLRAVAERDAYANLVLPSLLRDQGIESRDAGFATELAYGTLRWQGLYDAILTRLVSRPLADLDDGILDILRLGCHQILMMRVPEHAAVSATVDLARTVMTAGPSAMVNAVLRKVTAHSAEEWAELVAPAATEDPMGHAAVRWSHPRWIVSAFNDALGGDAIQLEALLEADNTPAAVTLVARPGRAEPAELLEMGAEPGRWSPLAGVLPSGDPGAWEQVRRGHVGVQDEGSQLVALALAGVELDVDEAGSVEESAWLDLCAGPGGKAALLAGLADARGASLTANEVREHRALLVERALMHAPGRHEVVVADGRHGPWSPASFDRVLVDAPCTGLGALRRRPEARWRRTAGDVAALVPLQRALFSAALDAVRPGGVVAYVTCSPHLAETVMVVGDVLRGRTDVEQIDARPYLPGVPDLGPGPHVQLWPHLHGTDAMFLALARRRSN